MYGGNSGYRIYEVCERNWLIFQRVGYRRGKLRLAQRRRHPKLDSVAWRRRRRLVHLEFLLKELVPPSPGIYTSYTGPVTWVVANQMGGFWVCFIRPWMAGPIHDRAHVLAELAGLRLAGPMWPGHQTLLMSRARAEAHWPIAHTWNKNQSLAQWRWHPKLESVA